MILSEFVNIFVYAWKYDAGSQFLHNDNDLEISVNIYTYTIFSSGVSFSRNGPQRPAEPSPKKTIKYEFCFTSQ